jgi:hypothetical protein
VSDKLTLDIFWLKDESLEDSANLPDPDIIAAEWSEWTSDMEGKVTRVGGRERGQRTSFKSSKISKPRSPNLLKSQRT